MEISSFLNFFFTDTVLGKNKWTKIYVLKIDKILAKLWLSKQYG